MRRTFHRTFSVTRCVRVWRREREREREREKREREREREVWVGAGPVLS